MLPFAINHMTVPRLDWRGLLSLAAELDCIGVEFRNDLPDPLFSGAAPEVVRDEAARLGLRIIGLSQVYPFNSFSDAIRAEVQALIATANACGAETISLIPRNDGTTVSAKALRHALGEIRPLLDEAGMTALVEPLGFRRSSLRSKAETIEAIEAVGGADRFRIVHDTFHHFLAQGSEMFPDWTGLVHISGVSLPDLPPEQMEDEHRILVDENDRLGNVDQIAALRAAGYAGPISMESFSPAAHGLDYPLSALRTSFQLINRRITSR